VHPVLNSDAGLHVLKYTGPRADEIPKTGTYSSNRTSPH
jgi:hypothetical protein